MYSCCSWRNGVRMRVKRVSIGTASSSSSPPPNGDRHPQRGSMSANVSLYTITCTWASGRAATARAAHTCSTCRSCCVAIGPTRLGAEWCTATPASTLASIVNSGLQANNKIVDCAKLDICSVNNG